jgi:hypothetical protein
VIEVTPGGTVNGVSPGVVNVQVVGVPLAHSAGSAAGAALALATGNTAAARIIPAATRAAHASLTADNS